VRVGSAMDIAVAGQDVLIRYPKAFSLGAILPQVRLEIGPLAAWTPVERTGFSDGLLRDAEAPGDIGDIHAEPE